MVNFNRMYYRLEDFFYKVKRYFINCYSFRKELSNFYDWNYDLSFLRRSIELNMIHIQKYGYEVQESRNKKISKMKEAIEMFKHIEDDDFIELAEKETGLKYTYGDFNFEKIDEKDEKGENYYQLVEDRSEEEQEINSKLLYLSIELKEKMWRDVWDIIKGQEHSIYKERMQKNKDYTWDEFFDGSGILGWWD